MLRVTLFILAIIITGIICLGCSGGGSFPTVPEDITRDPVVETPSVPGTDREPDSQRVLWGVWNFDVDISTMTITPVRMRNLEAHFNITPMVLPPACDDCLDVSVNSFSPGTGMLDADATLINKFGIPGRDVRGILFTTDYGHLLRNPDGWTPLFDMPGGMEYNPFKAYAKDEIGRIFGGSAEHMENYLIQMPTPPQWSALAFAVDASWPGNCPEPYSIDDFVQDGNLYQFNGASVDLMVAVNDWQGDVNSVQLSAPDIAGPGFVDFTLLAGNVWQAILVNSEGATAGEYEVMVRADSGTPPSILLVNFFTVTITETTEPVVTGVEPGNGERGSSLDYVTVIGDNFVAPAQITLAPGSGPDINTTNVVVQTENLITFDVDIPLGATVGLYDVELSNGDGKDAVGTDMFEVTNPTPSITSIDPVVGDAGESLVDVTIDGDFFYGPATVEFIMEPSDIFTADNVVVVDVNTIECDVNIPITAGLGDYDVKVTNADTKFAMGTDLFEVICPIPTVTAIDPVTGEKGENLTGVEITGTNFYGSTADVKLTLAGEPDIVCTNIAVVSPTTITCDINIPWIVEGGFYSVEVINGCGETGSGAGLFELIAPDPFGWARTWGGTSWDTGECVAVDDTGNVFVTGDFNGAVDFDPGPGELILTATTDEDAFLCKYNDYGIVQWAVNWGAGAYAGGREVVIDDAGLVYVAGMFQGTTDFDPGPAEDIRTAAPGVTSGFLSVFDSDGVFIRAHTFGGTVGTWVYNVAVDGSYNVYIAGEYADGADLNPDPLNEDIYGTNGNQDVFFIKLDAGGNYCYAHTWGGSAYDMPNGMCVDSTGNVYITGYFSGNVDLDPSDGEDWHDSGTSNNTYLSKFASNGDFLWAHDWGSPTENASGMGVAVGGDYIYCAGYFAGTGVDFDPDPVGEYVQDSNGSNDIFLLRFDSAGDFQWCKTWGGSLSDQVSGVGINDSGNLYVSGTYRDTVDFDPVGTDEHTSNGGTDSYICRYDSSGNFIWARTWGSDTHDVCSKPAVNSLGESWVTGYYMVTVDFNPDPVEVEEHTVVGENDIYLMKLLPDGLW